MLLRNMNWLGVLCKLVRRGQSCVIVEKSILGEATHGVGEIGKGCVKFF